MTCAELIQHNSYTVHIHLEPVRNDGDHLWSHVGQGSKRQCAFLIAT